MAKKERADESFKRRYAEGTREFHEFLLGEGDLSGCSFDRVELYEANFLEGRLEKTTFKRSALIECAFDDVRAAGLVLQGCDVARTRFAGADLTGSTWRKIQSGEL